jgi:hypothetical protein
MTPTPDWIPYETAATLIGCDRYDVVRLIQLGWLRGNPDLREPAGVRRVDALAWAPDVPGRYVAASAATRLLRGSGATVRELADAGLVTSRTLPGCPTRYRREDVEAWARRTTP